jgi:long-chain fatty acid transport protein
LSGAIIVVLLTLGLAWGHTPALGAGFALLQQGTAAMAQGNAFVAEADDASAIFYNPAGLNQLPRPQFYQALILNHPDREFEGGGQSSETNHRLYRNMSVYFAAPLNSRIALGIGFFSPFGLGTAWPPTWAGRYLTTFSSMHTYCLNPVISVKPLENLSLAAGFDWLYSKVTLKRKFQIAAGRQTFDGETSLTGDGSGVGYNLGLLYQPLTWLKLGVSYRSAITVTHGGQLNFTVPVGVAPNRTSGSADLTFPPSVTMGISCSYFKPLTLEFDTTWTGWSTYDELKVDLKAPVPVNQGSSQTLVTPKNWHDAWAFRFGANYEVKEGMKIRAGYIYDLTPVPGSTFDPQVPDANRHIFTVGGDLKIKRFTLGIAYNYILSEARTKANAISFNGVPLSPALQANGRYTSDSHSLGLSWSFRF